MFRIIAAKNTFEGELRNFELGGDDLLIRFALTGQESIDVSFPKVPPVLKDSIGRMGLVNLKNTTINLNTGEISFNVPIESSGKSVKEGKKRIRDTRPRLKLGGGSMVG